jgi:CheY-like chemotaxis protein
VSEEQTTSRDCYAGLAWLGDPGCAHCLQLFAPAVHPTETSEQERQRRLHGLQAELSEADSVQQIADVLRDVGTIVLGAYRVRLWTVDGAAAHTADAAVALNDETHPIAYAITASAPLWLPLSAHAALVKEPDEPMRAACVIPLIVEGAVIGAIDFAFSIDRRFFPEEREFLTAVADQVAAAVDRARLPVIKEWPTGSQQIRTIAPAALAADARRILIVDDDADAAEELREALEAMGHDVVVVYNRDAAVTAAHEWAAEYAFVELCSENTGGYELVAQLCKLPSWERTRFVPLQKPIDLEDIAALLARQ